MKTNLKFMVASSPGHYRAAQALIRTHVDVKQQLSFPTIMAWDGDKLVGVCATRVIDSMIIAGPLVVIQDEGPKLFTIMRLCEAYNTAMEQVGVESFIIGAEQGSILQRAIGRYFPDLKPYASVDGSDYYIWKVKGYGEQRQGSGAIGRGETPPEEPGRAAGAASPNY